MEGVCAMAVIKSTQYNLSIGELVIESAQREDAEKNNFFYKTS